MSCNICPQECNTDRTNNLGFCQAPNYLKINTSQLHYGEEPVISGNSGSGTIFFSHCNMQCCYCQNYKISALGSGFEISPNEFIDTIYKLKKKGAHNINLVSPTPYTSVLVPVLEKLKKSGFDLPIVWNSNAYEKVETLKTLEGLVDIYLPDFRYWNDDVAYSYSNVKNYRETAQNAIKEMYRQTGNLKINEDGIAIFGTLIRLLVLPKNINNTEQIIQWLYVEFGNDLCLSLMSQYYPAYNAKNYDDLGRGVAKAEYEFVMHVLLGLGFENGFIQEPATTPEWTPEFLVSL